MKYTVTNAKHGSIEERVLGLRWDPGQARDLNLTADQAKAYRNLGFEVEERTQRKPRAKGGDEE